MRAGILVLAAALLLQECVRWGQLHHQDMMEKFNNKEDS